MRALLRLIVAVLAACWAGCFAVYKAPAADEPHALLKLRRVYHEHGLPWNTTRSEVILIDDTRLNARDSGGAVPQTQAVRVRPGVRTLGVSTHYGHSEYRSVEKTEWVTKYYDATETYWEDGKFKSRTVTRTKQEPETRWVTESVYVTDDRCSSRRRFVFNAGRMYLVQYTFTAHSRCSMVCLEQAPAGASAASQLKACKARAAL